MFAPGTAVIICIPPRRSVFFCLLHTQPLSMIFIPFIKEHRITKSESPFVSHETRLTPAHQFPPSFPELFVHLYVKTKVSSFAESQIR